MSKVSKNEPDEKESSTNITQSEVEDVFGEMNFPVVKYSSDDGDGSLDILYKNDRYDEVFEFESTSELKSDPVTAVNTPNTNHIPTDHPAHPDIDHIVDPRSDNTYIIELLADSGKRKFMCKSIAVNSDETVEIYYDLTREIDKEKYLDILQRILRHNLRNDLNVILGYSNTLLEEIDDDSELYPMIESIHDNASNLSTLSEETRTIRSIIDDDAEPQKINLSHYISIVVDQYRKRYPNATITVSESGEGIIKGTYRIETLIESLVSNAIEHNSGDIRVEIVVEPTTLNGNDVVSLKINDNGSGIPKKEREIISSSQPITSLNHGSGLGLWVVRWIADQHGATIDFSTSSSAGTSVTVYFNTW